MKVMFKIFKQKRSTDEILKQDQKLSFKKSSNFLISNRAIIVSDFDK